MRPDGLGDVTEGVDLKLGNSRSDFSHTNPIISEPSKIDMQQLKSKGRQRHRNMGSLKMGLAKLFLKRYSLPLPCELASLEPPNPPWIGVIQSSARRVPEEH